MKDMCCIKKKFPVFVPPTLDEDQLFEKNVLASKTSSIHNILNILKAEFFAQFNVVLGLNPGSGFIHFVLIAY